MAERFGRRRHPDDPPASSAHRHPDPDRIQQRRGPRSRRDDHGVRVDRSVVRHDPADAVAVLDQRSNAQVMPDLGAGRLRGERQGHGQRRGIQPVTLVEEPAGHRVRRDRGFGFAQLRGVERPDRHALRRCRRQRVLRSWDVLGLERHQQVADGLPVDPDGERGRRRDVEVLGKGGAGHRLEDRILREDEPSLVPARGAGRELVAFDQRDARSRARQLVRTRGADDPAPHDRDVRHRRRLAR